MRQHLNPDQLREELVGADDLLIVQDLDGVCMQLVKDPLARQMDAQYILAAAKLEGEFYVLTNGEHAGRRGVNKLVDEALGDTRQPHLEGLYLPGLAAGGVQLQNRFGQVNHPGVSKAEMNFLATVPTRMKMLLEMYLPPLLTEFSSLRIANLIHQAILDTSVSPTINLNGILELLLSNVDRQRELQQMLEKLMEQLLQQARDDGLGSSFFLHIAPNLGRDNAGHERLKPAVPNDIGTTDIQFMLTGSLKEAGLIMLLNLYVARRTGRAPLGDDFNVRTAPQKHHELMQLVQNHIPIDQMPLLVGVGDTVTSEISNENSGRLRGGSDRGFLTLLKDLGDWCGRRNRAILVDSSHGEIDRPKFFADGYLKGISDPEDPLHLDLLMPGGPDEYISWFKLLANRRWQQKHLA